MTHETLQEAYQHHREHARLSERRHRVFHRTLVRWVKRNHPEELERLWAVANKKVPNLSGRKAKLRIKL